jgi:hypothetical protein
MQLTISMAWDLSSATDDYLIRQEIAFILSQRSASGPYPEPG